MTGHAHSTSRSRKGALRSLEKIEPFLTQSFQSMLLHTASKTQLDGGLTSVHQHIAGGHAFKTEAYCTFRF